MTKITQTLIREILSEADDRIPDIKTKNDAQLFAKGLFAGAILQSLMPEAAANKADKRVEKRGGFGNREEEQMLHALRRFFRKRQYSRFLPINEYNELEQKIANKAIGYRKEVDGDMVFYAYPERFRKAVRKETGTDAQELLKLAARLGMLERTDRRHFTKNVRLKNRIVRMLIFNSKVLADEE
jgi:uncharacterized protein (DUF927 family)